MKLNDIGRNVFIYSDGSREVFAQRLFSDSYVDVKDFFEDRQLLMRFEAQIISDGKLRMTLRARRQQMPSFYGTGGGGGSYYYSSATKGSTWIGNVSP
jgi:hypothetical protein